MLDDAGARLIIRASAQTHPDAELPELEAEELASLAIAADPLPA